MSQFQTAGPSARPKSTDLAIKLIYVGVAIGLVSLAVQYTMAPDNLKVTPTALIVGLVLGLAIPVLFAVLLGKGLNWARIVYTVLTGLSILFGLFGVLGSFTLGFALAGIINLVSLALAVVILVLLFRPDSNAFFR